ncbi:MAG: hypothetical protein IKR07_00780 [Oscillospiraceae bacterium]|nr:hypothetical protein [Oscillospiraceae bacterium]
MGIINGGDDLVTKTPKERSPEDKARVEAMKARIAAGAKPPVVPTRDGKTPPAAPAAPAPGAMSPEKILEIAKEVIQGKWDVGQARIDKLKAAGFDPEAVQKKVNELLK